MPIRLTIVADGNTGHFLRGDGSWATPPGAGGGNAVEVNGVSNADRNLSDSTPAAPSNAVNVKWQEDASTPRNTSAYVQCDGTGTHFLSGAGTFTAIQDAAAGAKGIVQLSGDLTGTAASPAIAAHAVSNAKFRQGAGLSVVGVSGAATADVADIVDTVGGANANGYLQSNGTNLVFNTLAAADVGIANQHANNFTLVGGTFYVAPHYFEIPDGAEMIVGNQADLEIV